MYPRLFTYIFISWYYYSRTLLMDAQFVLRSVPEVLVYFHSSLGKRTTNTPHPKRTLPQANTFRLLLCLFVPRWTILTQTVHRFDVAAQFSCGKKNLENFCFINPKTDQTTKLQPFQSGESSPLQTPALDSFRVLFILGCILFALRKGRRHRMIHYKEWDDARSLP